MTQWARSTVLFRQWAEEWVLYSLWDALCGCIGDNKVLLTSFKNFTVEQIIKDTTACNQCELPEPSLTAWAQIKSIVCNRKWIVGCGDTKEEVPSLFIHKVEGGAPVGDDVVVKTRDIRMSLVELAPLSDDTLILHGKIGGGCSEHTQRDVVTLVDLEATFNNKELVVKSKIECNPPLGASTLILRSVTWLPDGSPCILMSELVLQEAAVNVTRRTLVDALSSETTWEFPDGKLVTTLNKSHVFVRTTDSYSSEPTEFQVFHNGNLSQPSLCLPCTWSCPHRLSGLILSTSYFSSEKDALQEMIYSVTLSTYQPRNRHHESDTTEIIEFSLHDGVTGFRLGVITLPLKLFKFKKYYH
ncbi:hypothetical protein Pelo_17855 [Pelomyxa schiedti]|nr:hypothetical protein Pelo_17855 [Pelomyxa schiedti]